MAYIAPNAARTTGTLITATIWNQDVGANVIAINAGAIQLASQAALDMMYASTATQWVRIPGVLSAVLVTSGAGVPSLGQTLPTAVQDNITRTGTLVAGATGAGFTVALSTSTITGTLADARLSANVPLLNASNTFTGGAQAITGAADVSGFTVQAVTTGRPVIGLRNTTTGLLCNIYAFNDKSIGIYPNDVEALSISATGLVTLTGNLATHGLAFTGTNGGGIAATHASGTLRFFAGGTTEWLRLGTAGDLGIAATKKLCLDGVALTGNTYIHEVAADRAEVVAGGTAAFAVNASSIGIPATAKLYIDGVALSGDTYVYESAANVLDHVVQGVTATSMIVSNGSPVVTLPSGAYGVGATNGAVLVIGRNSSGNGAAGILSLITAAGTQKYLWVDGPGDLRISVTVPEEDGTPSDTHGTVVGAQTSRRALKNIYGRYTYYRGALNTILAAQLWDFDYKSGACNHQRFIGITTDDDPVFGMDEGRVFNPITAHGITVGAMKELYRQMRAGLVLAGLSPAQLDAL